MHELTIASFNTHWGVDSRGDPFDVVEAARGLDADVLVLQEVWRPAGATSWIDRLEAASGLRIAAEVVLAPDSVRGRPRRLVTRPGPPGTWGVAVLTRLPTLRHFEIDLGRAPADVIARRIALGVEVDVGGAPLLVAGVHASHKLWGSPPQVRRLDRRLAAEVVPSVIAGDLNMWGPVLGLVLRGRRRAVRGRTFPGHRPHSQIDHVWVGADVDVVWADVSEHLGSDHRAVRAHLRLR